MNKVGAKERETQNRITRLFEEELDYAYLGDWQDRSINSNIERELLEKYLTRRGYTSTQIKRSISLLQAEANNFSDDLYTTNKNVYTLLRYGTHFQTEAGKNFEPVFFINWNNFTDNDFAIAEEVTIKGKHTKRPDIVIYVNGIALSVIELKRSKVSLTEGIRQSIGNQKDEFIQHFFATVQFIFAGNDTEGLRYGTIGTEEKYYLKWKEDVEDNSRYSLDKYLLKLCNKERFLEIIYDFVLFDGGTKKLPRVHQYFAVKEAQKYVNRYEGGIIWHTQGSGKSLVMVTLGKWLLENNPNARIAIVTDRDVLDKQIERVFEDVGEEIYRTSSGADLMHQLEQARPRLLCSLIHKFGRRDVTNFSKFIQELEAKPSKAVGELFVFVDECHRTQSGKLHRTMKAMLPNAVFIGFTGTPLLKKDKKTSLEVFGRYIHTYKFNEGVADNIILDLVYEARDIDQRISSSKKIDEWFDMVTDDLNDYQKAELKKRWGTMQKVLSSKTRMEKIVNDIVYDFKKRPRLSSDMGNALLVASSIYEACKFYELFENSMLRGNVALVTSYNPNVSDITTEAIGANTETQKEYIYSVYKKILKEVKPQPNKTKTEVYEDRAKEKFKKEPATMKLIIVVSKLLTGFDAPPCSYLYIDKTMQDHGLFQAICRVNRLHTDDKQNGYIIDYQDLFKQVEDAVAVYTSELDYDEFEPKDIDILLQDRLKTAKKRLENSLEELALLCEPVEQPKETLDYIHYFCGNTEIPEDLKERETQRDTLYKKIVTLVRAYADIEDEIDNLDYSQKEIASIKSEVKFYLDIRAEIRRASGEEIDLKKYEPDMRHLIDTYIQADDSEKISPFDDMPLLDIINNMSMADAINSLPKNFRKNQDAVAETIINNVRKKIIREHLNNPAFYDDISRLLDEIVKERRNNAINYKEFLERIGDLIEMEKKGTGGDTPDSIATRAQKALYSNLGKDEDLANEMHQTILEVKRDDWRGHPPKENEIKAGIYQKLKEFGFTENFTGTRDDKPPYGQQQSIEDEVERIFKIIEQQEEY